MDGRQQRGMQIAEKGGIEKGMKGYIVPSQYSSGIYLVQLGGGGNCTCPDCQTRNVKCKHQYAVQYYLKKETDVEGNTVLTETKRVTYPQNWKAYNKAQTSEIKLFDELLRDLVETIDEPTQEKTGRPHKSVRDDLFCSIQKVYSQLSQRRAYTLYTNAEGRGQVKDAPHFNRIGRVLNREDIEPILQKLLSISALPLKSVESVFAPDSSGFRTTQFNEYCKQKHGTNREHQWLKAHILVGAKTNVIASARVTDENAGDSPQFAPMVSEAHDYGFTIKEIPADKAYSSRDNHDLADEIGATAYIPFKSNTTGKARGSLTWSRMYHYFMLNREEFMSHYHQRSNAETAFNMIKAKLGDKLKSKNRVAQKNELLCKFIAHNIIVLIHEMFGLGITPEFGHATVKSIGYSPCKFA